MPIYEYQCNQCGQIMEVIQSVSDSPLNKCRYCGSNEVSKKMSLSTFVLKGSGWYATDYANNSSPKNSMTKKREKKEEKGKEVKKKQESKQAVKQAKAS